MDQQRWSQVNETLRAALDLDPSERANFLNRHCGEDLELKAEVEQLLGLEEQAEGFLEAPVVSPPPATPSRSDSALPQLDGYRILEELGAGGMGRVYLAEQSERVRRKVAVKFLAMESSKEILARFESERQVLALMSQNNIARVFDAGTSRDGRPFLVMEYVPGLPITDYANEHRLDIQGRLKLFIKVLTGVQHAHQKGVIHRDLKPSNILVKIEGDEAVPKIIDFGVAKALDRKLTDSTIHTLHGSIVGTPDYMSPEQAVLNPLDVDIRSDIYSLGVLLYELLVGALPHDPARLRQAGVSELQRIIREEEPPSPSSRLVSLGDSSVALLQARQTTRSTLRRELEGELDWIVMKALEKDRTRRYPDVSGLSDDIQRYLRGDAVLARPPSRSYRVRKFVRRHRAPVVATTLFSLLFVVASFAVLSQYLQAERAKEQLSREVGKFRLAQEFLEQMLASADPAQMGRGVRVVEVLDRAAERLRTSFSEEPEVAASLRNVLARTYFGLGAEDKAESLFLSAMDVGRTSLGNDHVETLKSVMGLGELRMRQGRYEDAVTYFREAVAGLARKLPISDDYVHASSGLSVALKRGGDFDEAERYLREAISVQQQLQPNSLAKHALNMNLSRLLQARGKYEQARPIMERALAGFEEVRGPTHPDTLAVRTSYGWLLEKQKDFAGAETCYQEVLRVQEEILGPIHRETLQTRNHLAGVITEQGQLQRGRELYEGLLRQASSRMEPNDLALLIFRKDYGGCLTRLGSWEEAEQELLAVSKEMPKRVPSGHPATKDLYRKLATLYRGWGKPAEAELYQERAESP